MDIRKEGPVSVDFRKITISLASPETILERSHGEVTKPETINYRTYKPERDGLFCERIFGPVKDWECGCGKYKRIRYKGIVCDRCGVEVTEKRVRRERMGHINLVIPIAHIWFFRSLPNKIGSLLGIQTKKLESIIYYERYVVIQPGIAAKKSSSKDDTGVEYLQMLSDEEYYNIIDNLPQDNQYLDDSDPNKFVAKMGGEALYDLLKRINLDELSYELRDRVDNETSQQRKQEALKRLNIVEAFRDSRKRMPNNPEWMILRVLPVIPPDLRPLVPLDGGRFATSDINDLYRKVIIRNNRLKKLIEIKAPDVIMRNEKRMLQEAVDSLFDNSRKTRNTKSEGVRPLKSLSDSLKGKQGRFRQNLLGKRVDYSGRSVIVVGPDLKMNECGLPKDMAAELFKPFIIRKMLERGIVKTVKSAKKIVEKKDPVVWDILESTLKGHPVLLNRAPTLHRLGIQAFQPKLIEGKAIRLHPLVCTAFNADFDGDQMAVHVPLSNAAILEAQILMLASHNILNPANGAPITVPSQDMVLGLYYLTKGRKSTKEEPVLGEGSCYYSPEEAIIAFNEKKVEMHAYVKVRIMREDGTSYIQETTMGRILFNQVVPEGFGYIDELMTKKSLRDIIAAILEKTGMAKTVQFLDDIKQLGYQTAFKGSLSFNLGDVIIPEEKKALVAKANEEVEEVMNNYNLGFITNNERYNQIIDIWTHTNSNLTATVMKQLSSDRQGFNSVYMMLDSGARGSKEQIRQLCGMRGLMAKPQKSGATGGEIIENPILSNFKEGLSVLEYFISTHGARKGLADTALKTADAGYLTRRLVDVAQDVIISEEDCHTQHGLMATALKKNDEVVETLYERILGRTTVEDVRNPLNNELIVKAGEEITESIARKISESPIEEIEIRSVLTCESKQGVCAKCYGRNLATSKMVQKGEAVGVIAAQSIGEPGTQLTLRTFHVGGVAGGNIGSNAKIVAKYDGVIEIDELRSVPYKKQDENGTVIDCEVVIGRSAELRLVNSTTGIVMTTTNIPYGAYLYKKANSAVKQGELIADWDPYNAVIISEVGGKVAYQSLEVNVTYRIESDDQTGHEEKVIIESRQKSKTPSISILSPTGDVLKIYDLPIGAHIAVENKQKITQGDILIKIPRSFGKASDITGGLPRVQELFEARNPSNPAIVAEIEGIVTFGKKLKRGHKEIVITSRMGDKKSYLIPTSKQILAQENDYIKAGMPLSEGSVTPSDILAIKGPMKVQEYIVNEVQEVYRLQGVKINDKHFEIIVRQMMRKVEVIDPGDTTFLEGEVVNKLDLIEQNDRIYGEKVVIHAGDSEVLKAGRIVTVRQLRDENSVLKRKNLNSVKVRDARPATARQILQGITRASLQVKSFLSAASFQETTKVLTDAAVNAKSDNLEGLKENVLVGHLVPAGTGLEVYQKDIVYSQEEYNALQEQMAL